MVICSSINLFFAIFFLSTNTFVFTCGTTTVVSISMSQMSRFLIGMDNFVAYKCQITAEMAAEEEEKELRKCITEMKVGDLDTFFDLNSANGQLKKLFSRQSSGESSASGNVTPISPFSPKNAKLKILHLLGTNYSMGRHLFDRTDRHNSKKSFGERDEQKKMEMTADEFICLLLKKMLKKLPEQLLNLPGKIKQQIVRKQKTIAQKLSELTSRQNLLMIHELFYYANNILGVTFLEKIEKDSKEFVEKEWIDFDYYKEINRKFDSIYKAILINDDQNAEKKTFIFFSPKIGTAFFWFNFSKMLNVKNEWHEGAENILEWQFKVKIRPLKFGKTIKRIDQFINRKCGKNFLLLEENDAQKCQNKINFHNFLKEFPQKNDKSLKLLNLIGNLINAEALAETEENQITKNRRPKQKICFLNELLGFGHLFVNIIGNLFAENAEELQPKNWKNIKFILIREDANRKNEEILLKQLLMEVGNPMGTKKMETEKAPSRESQITTEEDEVDGNS